VPGSWLDDGLDVGGLAKDIDRDDGACAVADRGLNLAGVDVEGIFFDIGEDGFGALEDGAISGGDKTEGRSDDLVAGANAGGGEADMQAAGAAIDGDSIARASVGGDSRLEGTNLRADAEDRGAENGEDGFNLGLGDRGLGERNLHTGEGLSGHVNSFWNGRVDGRRVGSGCSNLKFGWWCSFTYRHG